MVDSCWVHGAEKYRTSASCGKEAEVAREKLTKLLNANFGGGEAAIKITLRVPRRTVQSEDEDG